MRNMIFTAGFLAVTAATTGAFAQDAAPAGGTASGNVGVSLPGAAPAAATAGGSDHDQMVGRLAVGYFGVSQLGAGAAIPGGVAGPGSGASPYAFTGSAPIVGVRYWLDPMMGIDVGLGVGILGGGDKVEVPGTPAIERDRDSFLGLGLHAGVPLSLASSGHFSFQVIPEMNVLYASVGTDTNGADDPNTPAVEGEGDQSHTGLHFDIGARAGAEIHFGFMGIPQLALQGSIGLMFALDSGSSTDSTTPTPPGDVDSSSTRTSFGTTVGSNPWAIFTNNIAALYYF